ncbi:MAG TPA: UDP-3-O-(3-hydroxymyristoyl)glucosamine N-acyltransferase, partial [Sulfurimonas sp.]|nr:UDP-3-O-(3-hydroxymyristoyl)glucosamine N-acyltransferase [Sulfurimonas sp.]
MKLSEIAQLIGAEFTGDDKEITSMNTLSDASATEISFVANVKYIKEISSSNAAAIICDIKTKDKVPSTSIALVVDAPYWEMATLTAKFAPLLEDSSAAKAIIGEGSNVSTKAEIANGAKVGKNCNIMAGVYIGSQAIIGDNTILYPNVVIYRDCKVGSNCVIHAGTVVGSDGFGFASDKMGMHKKIYHIGNVVIEDDVEIGSNTSIDRAVFSTTYVKQGARLDNLVHVAHNCEIGEYSVIAGQ